jgi:hypothetical protein
MTPEGKIKTALDRALVKLRELGHALYWHKPVMNGMGAPTLDYVGCCWSFYFTIETKAPGKKPTAIQEQTIGKVQTAHGTAFVIDSEELVAQFVAWVEQQALRYTRLVYLDRT